MASPYRRKNSRNYYVDIWFHGKRQTIALGTDNYGIARTKAGQYEHEARTGGLVLPTRHEIGPLVERYIRHMHAHRRFKGAQSDAYRLRELFGGPSEAERAMAVLLPRRGVRPVLGRHTKRARTPKTYEFRLRVNFIEQVTTALLLDGLTKLATVRNISPKTWREYRGTLHGFFVWAMETAGVIMPGRANPAAAIPTRSIAPRQICFLNLTEIHEQLDVLADHPQIQVMVAVYIYAGLRREELLWLTPADVDLERRVIHVRAKTVAGQSWRPKTNRNRKVPISAALLGYLQAYTPRHTGPWLFPSPEGHWWNPDNFSHRLADFNRKAGSKWSCAEYRHTFGTQLAMAGRDERTIAELMGNSPAIVRRHYAAWLPEAHPEAVEFDQPDGATPMASARTANLRIEALRRGLKVLPAG